MLKNLSGKLFGYLYVIQDSGNRSKSGQVKWICKCRCGMVTCVRSDQLISGHTKSCGCFHKEIVSRVLFERNPMKRPETVAKFLGPNHPNWKGGLSELVSEREKFHASDAYKDWRKKVFNRDRYTCTKCNDNKGGNLVAHHIHNFSSYPDLRTDIDNGITFCVKCHRNFHHIFGYKDNDFHQLDMFFVLF